MAQSLVFLPVQFCEIPINAVDSEAAGKTVQIQISWLLMKPADLDLHCFLKRIDPGSAGQGLRPSNGNLEICIARPDSTQSRTTLLTLERLQLNLG